MRNTYLLTCASIMCLGALSGCVVDPEPNPNPNPGSPDFLASQYFPAGLDPLAVRAADLNGDGKSDLVVANNAGNSVSVILSHPETVYGLHTDLVAGTAPVSLFVGKITADAIPDIVCVNSGSSNISLFPGNGDGSFAAPITIGLLATAAPIDVTAADLDADGDLDVITADSGTNSVSIFKNEAGTLATIPTILPVGVFPRAVLATDLNGDTKPDLVATNRNSDNISVLLNLGLGVFAPAVPVPVGTNPRQALPVDVDHDTDVDLVVTNPGSQNIAILLNNGSAIFSGGATIAVDGLPSRFGLGDFDSDGHTDLAVVMFSTATNNPSLGVTDLYFGNGTGSFPEMRRYGSGGASQDVAVADLNADGRLDLLAADSGRDAASILYGLGGGSFASDEHVAAGDQPREIAATDLDNDSDLDLVVITQDDQGLVSLKNNGSGGFVTGGTVALAGTPRGLAMGRINGDNFPDAAVSLLVGGNGVAVYMGKGDGTFITPGTTVPLPGRDPRSVAIGDVNKDGKADIVTGDSNEDQISVALGDGTGVFAAATHFDCGNFPLNVQLTDTNGDAKLDIVFLSRNDPESVTDQAEPRTVRVLGKGDGTFDTTTIMRVSTGGSPGDLVLGDVSGDGLMDAIVASASENSVYTHPIPSNGNVVPGVAHRAGIGARAIALGRVGGGLNLDILSINGDNTITVVQNSGSNAYIALGTYPAGADAIEGVAGDFDKDGAADIALANRGTDDVGILFGQ